MSKVKVMIHRGTHQIGGCCNEIATDATRILIDFGMSLPGENQSQLIVPGANRAGKIYDAILITHSHGDHIGELHSVQKDIPIYMGKSTKDILIAYKGHMGNQYLGGLSFENVCCIDVFMEY